MGLVADESRRPQGRDLCDGARARQRREGTFIPGVREAWHHLIFE
jgi:hypothetical protein